MDKAVEPDRKSWPKRLLIVLLSALVAAFVGVLSASILETLERARNDPRRMIRLSAFRRYLSWR
jgi:uncharacterized protein involved in exopolysaccharide biosynthesis